MGKAKTKVLDFGKRDFDNGSFARPRTLIWPVAAHRVTFPSPRSKRIECLNVFEAVLLRLIDADGMTDADKLAADSCMPLDFVKSVLLRLEDQGYLDERGLPKNNRLTLNDDHDYETGILFRELVSGQILPYVLSGSKPKTRLIRQGGYTWTMRQSVSKSPSICAKEVVSAMRQHKRHAKAYGIETFLPSETSIRVSDGFELYNLECRIGVRPIDYEFRIANPFGKGWALALERVFLEEADRDDNLEKWLSNWRTSLIGDEEATNIESNSRPYESDLIRSSYPNLVYSLKSAEEYGSIGQIFAAIEWALYYSNEKRGSRDQVNLINVVGLRKAVSLVEDAAISIGLTIPESGIPRMHDGDIERYLEGSPNLSSALAISLLQAEGSEGHPLRAIAAKSPGFLKKLIRVKTARDSREHGRGIAGTSVNQRYISLMQDVVSSLLPEVLFEESGAKNSAPVSFDSGAMRARNNLVSYFGTKEFNIELSPISQDRLLNAERMFIAFGDSSNATPILNALYAALQYELIKRIPASLSIPTTQEEIIEEANAKCRELGISELSDSLRSVRYRYLKATLQGVENNTTLGAAAIAFLLNAETSTLRDVLVQDSSFFESVGELTTQRGHGNESREMSLEEIVGYRESSYRALNALVSA